MEKNLMNFGEDKSPERNEQKKDIVIEFSDFAKKHGGYEIETVINPTPEQKKISESLRERVLQLPEGGNKGFLINALDYFDSPIILDTLDKTHEADAQRVIRQSVLKLLEKFSSEETEEGKSVTAEERKKYEEMYTFGSKNKLRRRAMVNAVSMYGNKNLFFDKVSFSPETDVLFKTFEKYFQKADGDTAMGYPYDYLNSKEKVPIIENFCKFLPNYISEIVGTDK